MNPQPIPIEFQAVIVDNMQPWLALENLIRTFAVNYRGNLEQTPEAALHQIHSAAQLVQAQKKAGDPVSSLCAGICGACCEIELRRRHASHQTHTE